MEQITKQLDSGKPIDEIEVKLQLTTLKPLHAEWLTDFYNLMTTSEGKDVILSDWKAAGIIQVIEKGSSQLESLDPFKDLDPLLSPASYNETINPTMLSDEVRQAFIDSAEFNTKLMEVIAKMMMYTYQMIIKISSTSSRTLAAKAKLVIFYSLYFILVYITMCKGVI